MDDKDFIKECARIMGGEGAEMDLQEVGWSQRDRMSDI